MAATKRKRGTCARCDRRAVHRGHIYEHAKQSRKKAGARRLKTSLKKRELPMCMAHFMESEFGLLAYECSDRCSTKRLARSRFVGLDSAEMVVWLPMGPILGGERPKCAWCGRRLRMSPEFSVEGRTS